MTVQGDNIGGGGGEIERKRRDWCCCAWFWGLGRMGARLGAGVVRSNDRGERA